MSAGSFDYVNSILQTTKWTPDSDEYYFRILCALFISSRFRVKRLHSVGTHKDLIPTCPTTQIRKFTDRPNSKSYLHLLPAGVRDLMYSYLPPDPVSMQEAEMKAKVRIVISQGNCARTDEWQSFGASFIAINSHSDAGTNLAFV
jgi:hypothetical protein